MRNKNRPIALNISNNTLQNISGARKYTGVQSGENEVYTDFVIERRNTRGFNVAIKSAVFDESIERLDIIVPNLKIRFIKSVYRKLIQMRLEDGDDVPNMFGKIDDRNKKKKLANYSWLELHTLYQLDRLYIETSSFLSYKSYQDYVLDFQIKTALEKWYKLLTDLITQSEYQSSLKSNDGNYIYKKGDKKWKTQIKRATGIEKIMMSKDDPEILLQNYDKVTRSR